jgi:hypothetical protein
MIWKTKVSKANVLLFQLQASVRGIKEKESGFLPTPTTMDHIDRKGMRPSRAATNRKTGYLSEMIKMYPTPTQDSASERTKKYSQGGMPLPMAVKMFPTPSASCHMDVVAPPETVTQNNQGWSVTRVGTGTKFGAKLNDVVNKLEVEMYPTPTTRDYKDSTLSNSHQNRNSDSLPVKMMKEGKPGGRLNPNFVEFLMGYPMNWTKIDPTE